MRAEPQSQATLETESHSWSLTPDSDLAVIQVRMMQAVAASLTRKLTHLTL